MPAIKFRNPLRLPGGLRVDSGSVSNTLKAIWAGSVAMESPSYSGASSIGSAEAVSVTVTGLNASMLVFVTPASIQAGPIALRGACAILNAIETKWIHTGSGAVTTCQVTLNYLAIQT